MSAEPAAATASFEVVETGKARVRGPLSFATTGALLQSGASFITGGSARSIDLSAVSGADSAGLALLIEWLSLSQAAGGTLRYENIPTQLMQLARLSEVEPLLSGNGFAQTAAGLAAAAQPLR
ncbi:MAG: STAS domain-containing protein [Proteobacteria bacterium]|nr:STAS domain-containing protein [Pseudomonadota bacterium]